MAPALQHNRLAASVMGVLVFDLDGYLYARLTPPAGAPYAVSA